MFARWALWYARTVSNRGNNMELKITTLSENTVVARPRGLLGEWGLSILVEADDLRLLLDTGQSISAANNGDILGVPWQEIDKIVLSHGHYDHTGGLRQILGQMKKRIEVIAHPDVWDTKYVDIPDTDYRAYVGIPFRKEDLESLGAMLKLTDRPVWLSDSVVTSGEIPMTTDYEAIDPGLCLKEEGQFHPDPLKDDQAVFIKTGAGLVVVLGCAHRGIINTLRHAQKVARMELIHAVIGGTHLFRASEAQLASTIAELKAMGVQRLGVSHCTGMTAAVKLAQEFSDNFFFNNAGTTITL
jgi:7,8-dihydropterin-6-yl-methyl-4-(beta-D-ribofuranosyl)aminobenzene 5'-phosphate synthase